MTSDAKKPTLVCYDGSDQSSRGLESIAGLLAQYQRAPERLELDPQVISAASRLKVTRDDCELVLRESQAKTLALPKTGMVTAVDIGAGTDIHPKDKLDVGKRLAQELITRDQVMAYYKARYVPNNLFFVVAGDIDADKVHERLAERLEFGR